MEYEAFIGPNTVEALKVYFAIRQREYMRYVPKKGHHVAKFVKTPGEVFTDETPIFAIATYPRKALKSKGIAAVLR